MKLRNQVVSMLLAATMLGIPGPAGAAPRTPTEVGPSAPKLVQNLERVTSVEGITEYQMKSNGLKVLLFPDPSKETITVNITYLVGSRHENYGETGMAHLLEHLVFKGTPRHPNIPQELTEHGCRPNGTTSFDRTNYFEIFSASEENLKWALDLEADRMVNSFIAKKDLDTEMTVVRNEFERGENEPFRVVLQRIQASAYHWHNYGKSTIGARSDIEQVPIERLQAFYRTYYQPDNAVLCVTGKINESRTLELINEYFGKIPKPTRLLQKTYTLDPIQDGERSVTVRRTGDNLVVGAAYHIPAGSHPDYAPLGVLSIVLADTPAGRLHKALVDTKKASVVAALSQPLKEPGLLLFGGFFPKQQSSEEAQQVLLKTIEEIESNPITDAEVARAKATLEKSLELALTKSDLLGLALSEYIAQGDWRLFFLTRDRFKQVTAAEVQRVGTKYLIPSNRTVGMFIPTEKPVRAEIPEPPDVTAMLKDYKGGEAIAAGEEFDPSPANIESRLSRSMTSSGFKITLLPKKTRGKSVTVNFSLPLGTEAALFNRAAAGNLASAMLMRGTTQHTRQEIQAELDRLKATLFIGGGATRVDVFIEAKREKLAEVLKLAAEILRQPAFSATEFDKLKQEILTGLETGKTNPQDIAERIFAKQLYPQPKGHPLYARSIEEDVADVQSVTLEQVKQFHADFYGAAAGVFVAVGDFDPQEIAPLAQNFGTWKAKIPWQRIPDSFPNRAPINMVVETPDKANAVFLASMPVQVSNNDPDYPALVLGNYLLGGGFLNSRLAVRIRQKEGLSYGVSSTFSAGSFEKVGVFRASAIYAPQNLKRLETAFQEELQRVLTDGFTKDEVAAAKTGYLQSRSVSRAQDQELAGLLANYSFLERTMVWTSEFEAKIQALTPEQIQAAMRKHLDYNKLSFVKAGDFAKVAKGKSNLDEKDAAPKAQPK